MYFVRYDFVALNIFSPPAGNAISACSNATHAFLSLSRFREAKCEVPTVERRVYYTFCYDTGLVLYIFTLHPGWIVKYYYLFRWKKYLLYYQKLFNISWKWQVVEEIYRPSNKTPENTSVYFWKTVHNISAGNMFPISMIYDTVHRLHFHRHETSLL